jgi:precorrin-3B synthase
MPTGDGLLARLRAVGTMPLEAFAGLCAAARTHGNGIVEITARGSIQVRGLKPSSARAFADAVGSLAIAAADGVPVVADPLAGLDPTEALDAGALAAELRAALASSALGAVLGPKVSIAIDGGGKLRLDAFHADVRLHAAPNPEGPRIFIALGGTAATAVPIGAVSSQHAIDAVLRLLAPIAALGVAARAEHVLREAGSQTFKAAISGLVSELPAPPARKPAEPIGIHPLRDGKVAFGIALPFGHADAEMLEDLADAASRAAVAPAIAAAAAPQLAGSVTRPLSGCTKGCAHRGAAALTIVGSEGRYALVLDGDARGAPCARVAAQVLPKNLGPLARTLVEARLPHERAADVLARLGSARIAAILADRAHD